MAVTIPPTTPNVVGVTLSQTPNTLTAVNLPTNAAGMVISVYPSADAYLTYAGTDDQPVGANVTVPLPQAQWTQLDMLTGTFYLGSTKAGAVVKLNFSVAR